MKRYLFLAPLLALTGCSVSEVATTGASVAGLFLSARPQASGVVQSIDKRLLIAANSAAEGTFLAGDMAFQMGTLPTSQDPDTARDNFCELVTAEPSLAIVTDQSGEALALRCRIEHHLDLAELAEKSNNLPAFTENLASAGSYNRQLAKLISDAVAKGVSK